MKERNRRLLAQHRELQQNSAKCRKTRISAKCRKYESNLRKVKEEEVVAGEPCGTPGNNSDKRDPADDERRRCIDQLLKKRTRVARRTGQRKLHRRKIKPRVKIRFGSWAITLWPVENIIRLYSCSAFRYVMFKSNRRYKPGD